MPAQSLLTLPKPASQFLNLQITAASTGSSAKVKEHFAKWCTSRETKSLKAFTTYMGKKILLKNLVLKQIKGLPCWAGKELDPHLWV